jgi:hypothetical protein
VSCDRVVTAVGRLALCASLMTVVPAAGALAADPAARIVLLAAGERASVVVEFDHEVPSATSIEAANNQSFDVEIGPVQGKVANQLLQAARQSALVTEVRVRAVPQGTQGTLIVLHVTAKAPVSGLVRRTPRRVYIDLEPLSIVTASKPGGQMPARSAAVSPPPASGTVSTTPQPPAPATSAESVPPAPPAPGTSPTGRAGQAPAGPVPTTSLSSPPTTDEILRRADVMAGQLDVKSLEKLKADWIARRASSASGAAASLDAPDPIVDKIDQYLDEARKKRLVADARLFAESKTAPAPAAAVPAPAAPPPGLSPEETFQRAISPLVPELEKMNTMLSQWQPGFVPAPSLPQSLQALALRLRATQPPTPLSASHERLCAALSALAKSWVPGPDGVSLIPVGNDTRLIVAAKAAIYDYLQLLPLVGSASPGRSTAPSP